MPHAPCGWGICNIIHTYIKQMELEKLVNEVMALPDDLKTKLSKDGYKY